MGREEEWKKLSGVLTVICPDFKFLLLLSTIRITALLFLFLTIKNSNKRSCTTVCHIDCIWELWRSIRDELPPFITCALTLMVARVYLTPLALLDPLQP